MISFWFIRHGGDIFIFFLIPIVGLILDYIIDTKKTFYTLTISVLLLLPALWDYTYTISYSYQIIGLISLGCIYRFYSKLIDRNIAKIISAILISGLLFVIFGYFAFMDGMSGNENVEQTWKIDNYKIEYIKDQGFSGGALMKYEISKYAMVPILVKHIDGAVDNNNNDTTSSCIVHFENSNIDFDKCKVTLTVIKQ